MGSPYGKGDGQNSYEEETQVIIYKDEPELEPEGGGSGGMGDKTFYAVLSVGLIFIILALLVIFSVRPLGYIFLMMGVAFAGAALYLRYEGSARPSTKGALALSMGVAAFLIWLVGGWIWSPLCMACFIPIMGAILIFIGVRVLQGKPASFSYTFPWARDDDETPQPQPPGAYHPPPQPPPTYPQQPQDPYTQQDPRFHYGEDIHDDWNQSRDVRRKR